MIGYGAKGDRIWGLVSFEVTEYGAKGDNIWGIVDRLWGAVLINAKMLILKGNNMCSGVMGDRIWGER